MILLQTWKQLWANWYGSSVQCDEFPYRSCATTVHTRYSLCFPLQFAQRNKYGNFVLRIFRMICYRPHAHNTFFASSSALWFLIADLLIINNKQELSTRHMRYVFNACPLYQFRGKNHYCATLIDAASVTVCVMCCCRHSLPLSFVLHLSFSQWLLLWPQKPRIC